MSDLTDEKKILAELLGTVDAVFIPMRGKFRQRPAQVRQERRAAWRSAGLPLRSHGADAGGRKDFENAARQLESAGLLIVERGQAGRRSVAKFSELGESVARTLAATGDVAMEWALFTNFAEMSKAVDGRPIAEHVVVGIRRWEGKPEQNRAVGLLEWRLLPYLTADLIEATGDAHGRVWYAITPAGRQAIEAGPPEPAPEGLRLDETFSDTYEAAMQTATAEMDAAAPEMPNALAIPMSAGIGWGVCPKELQPWTT